MDYIDVIDVGGVLYIVKDSDAVHDVDASLTKEGQAADAKVVGDALKAYITDVAALVGGDA